MPDFKETDKRTIETCFVPAVTEILKRTKYLGKSAHLDPDKAEFAFNTDSKTRTTVTTAEFPVDGEAGLVERLTEKKSTKGLVFIYIESKPNKNSWSVVFAKKGEERPNAFHTQTFESKELISRDAISDALLKSPGLSKLKL